MSIDDENKSIKPDSFADFAMEEPSGVYSFEAIADHLKRSNPDLEDLSKLLEVLVTMSGSDMHLSSGSLPMIRVRGKLFGIGKRVLNNEMVERYLKPHISAIHQTELDEKRSVDFAFKIDKMAVFRANVYHQRHGLSVALRILPEKPIPLDDLNMPSILKRALDFPNGLILVTGPTGSGKSTTLASMIHYLNQRKRGHVITLEDPIEFLHTSGLCLIDQRSYGDNFLSFADGIRAALREDPDYILVGEMRDQKTMRAAIKAAETGHLVFSTLHTGSAAKTVDRLLNSFPSGEQAEIRTVLADTLRMVVAQRLIASANGTSMQVFQDILVNVPAVSNLIREGKTHLIENVMQTSGDEGMQLMDRRIRDAVEGGEIRMADAIEQINDHRIRQDAEEFIKSQPVPEDKETANTSQLLKNINTENLSQEEVDHLARSLQKHEKEQAIRILQSGGQKTPFDSESRDQNKQSVGLAKYHAGTKADFGVNNGNDPKKEEAPKAVVRANLLGLEDIVNQIKRNKKKQGIMTSQTTTKNKIQNQESSEANKNSKNEIEILFKKPTPDAIEVPSSEEVKQNSPNQPEVPNDSTNNDDSNDEALNSRDLTKTGLKLPPLPKKKAN